MGGDWTVPAVELTSGKPQGTTLLVADGGRAAAEATIGRLLEQGQRVVAIDPFYFGESKIAKRDFLFALLVAAVGERPLGLQASQVAAASRWLAETRKLGPVTLVAEGPRSGLFALVAAGLSPETIAESRLRDSFGSLHEVLEQNLSADKTPELFCFGLLQRFDIKQLAALAAPRKVVFESASPRAKREMAELAAYYKLWGVTHQATE